MRYTGVALSNQQIYSCQMCRYNTGHPIEQSNPQVLISFLTHNTEETITLNSGMHQFSGFVVEISVKKNSPTRKHETTQCSTARFSEPWQIVVTSMHNVEKVVNGTFSSAVTAR